MIGDRRRKIGHDEDDVIEAADHARCGR